jgi:hypothetical protein
MELGTRRKVVIGVVERKARGEYGGKEMPICVNIKVFWEVISLQYRR